MVAAGCKIHRLGPGQRLPDCQEKMRFTRTLAGSKETGLEKGKVLLFFEIETNKEDRTEHTIAFIFKFGG